jgi:hypothetical protein
MYLGFLMVGLVACGTSEAKDVAKDSVGAEVVGGDTARSSGRSLPRVSPREHSLASGTRVEATTEKLITSRTNKAGETFTAAVSSDVKDSRGNIVMPSGSVVTLLIETLDPGNDQIRPDGRLAIAVQSVTVNGESHSVTADLTPVTHQMVGRGITTDEAERIGAGTAIGAVAGRLIGKSTKGAVVGGAAGAIAGTAVAVHYAYRDVVVAAGTPITFTLSKPLTVAAK